MRKETKYVLLSSKWNLWPPTCIINRLNLNVKVFVCKHCNLHMLPFNCVSLSVIYGALVLGLKPIQLLWSCLPHLKSPFFLLETHTEQTEGKQTMIVAFHECVSKPLSQCHCYLWRNLTELNWQLYTVAQLVDNLIQFNAINVKSWDFLAGNRHIYLALVPLKSIKEEILRFA